MRRLRLVSIVLFTLLFIAYPRSVLSQNIETITARVTNWKPGYWQENGAWVGMHVEMYQAIEKASGLTFNYIDLPWSRALRYMKDGACTIMANLSITPERQKFIHFLGPYTDEEMVLVMRKDDIDLSISSLDELIDVVKKRELKVGIEKDAWYGSAFSKRMKTDPEFEQYFNYGWDTLPKMMINKRVLGYFDQRATTVYYIRNVPEYRNLTISNFTVNSDVVFFGVTKKADPEILKRLQKAIQALLADGTFKRIKMKWVQY